jgi:acetoin utilization deacetylase AcuC-like enzyme
MKVFYAEQQSLHAPDHIVVRGVVAPNLEKPVRAQALLDTVRKLGHEVAAPHEYGLEPVRAVHDAGYLEFLENAASRWAELPNAGPLVHAHAFSHYSHRRRPSSIQGQTGYYLSGGSCPMSAGTWEAARWAANCALSAAQAVLDGEREAYALCRPPGHHAYADFAGGFCYLNNVAIAAHRMSAELGRVAILDIDVHHGNGTQSIFYQRDDVHFVSLHGDPDQFFPFYAGYADETGEGAGAGFNRNFPLPGKTGDLEWLVAMTQGLREIDANQPAALLVSLGFDAFAGDPSSDLAVTTEGFREAGRLIGATPRPVVLVQEGGYVVEQLAANLTAFLDGFFQMRPSRAALAR